MSDGVHFELEDHTVEVINALDSAIEQYLLEASFEIESQAARNTRVSTGKLKGSWTSEVDAEAATATVGSPEENAVWEELGTGEYAAEGNGRKGGWYIHESMLDEKAKSKMKKVIGKNGEVFYFTKGKHPTHALQKAFDSKKEILKKHAGEVLSREMGD